MVQKAPQGAQNSLSGRQGQLIPMTNIFHGPKF
jgi:hypothetical protein